MAQRSGYSMQTASILAALSQAPSEWRHGYALARQTGLKSGTLYPILIRLTDRGLLEARWQDEPEPGRPRRHLYRLTDAGLQAEAEAGAPHPTAAARPRSRSARLGSSAVVQAAP